MRSRNEYGVEVSVHVCTSCGDTFTVCPPRDGEPGWDGCLALGCPSYDVERDADLMFEVEPVLIHCSGDEP
jgi:hypothetical protein